MIYLTSDPHYGHHNIIKYTNRPFSSTHEMNKALTNNWNDIVNEDDVVYMLGDFTFDNPVKYLRLLKGNIIWIRGNHDRKQSIKIAQEVCNIPVYQRLNLDYGGYKFLLNHRPVLQNTHDPFKDSDRYVENIDDYDYILCGHVHEKWTTLEKNINVSVDVHNFKPISIDDIIEIYIKKQ